VRRRDVMDMFLGTGVGARAYAIIEQGMISRVIDAKPEELRVFLEEAAGISIYKERGARPKTACAIRATTWRGSKISASSWAASWSAWARRPKSPSNIMRCMRK